MGRPIVAVNLGFAAAFVLRTSAAFAQVGSVTATAPLAVSFSSLWSARSATANAAAAPTLTVLINSGATQTILSLVDNRINPFPTPVSITTSWNLSNLITSVDLVGYFTTPTAALVNGPNTLPSARMLGRVRTGSPTSFTSFTQNPVGGAGTPGGSLQLFHQPVAWPLNAVGQRSDELDLELDLRGLLHLPSGTYSGTLTIRAVAY
jgi:hypothetical protein